MTKNSCEIIKLIYHIGCETLHCRAAWECLEKDCKLETCIKEPWSVIDYISALKRNRLKKKIQKQKIEKRRFKNSDQINNDSFNKIL